jgi:hypothetical protein
MASGNAMRHGTFGFLGKQSTQFLRPPVLVESGLVVIDVPLVKLHPVVDIVQWFDNLEGIQIGSPH